MDKKTVIIIISVLLFLILAVSAGVIWQNRNIDNKPINSPSSITEQNETEQENNQPTQDNEVKPTREICGDGVCFGRETAQSCPTDCVKSEEFSELSVVGGSEQVITITWTTGEPLTSAIDYSTDMFDQRTIEDTTLKTEHQLIIDDKVSSNFSFTIYGKNDSGVRFDFGSYGHER